MPEPAAPTAGGTGGAPDGPAPPGPDPAADPGEPTSGTRLKAIWIVSADGARQFTSRWRDTDLGMDCGFQTSSDGVLRCLPTALATGSGTFTDPSCTERLFVRGVGSGSTPGECGAATGDYGEFSADGCTYRSRRFPLARVRPTQTYSRTAAGECVAVPANLDSYMYFIASGPEIPPDTFAAAELRTDD